jgi:type IV secretory pathway VirB6-like protein
MRKKISNNFRRSLGAMILAMAAVALSAPAMAQTPPPAPAASTVCTSFHDRGALAFGGGEQHDKDGNLCPPGQLGSPDGPCTTGLLSDIYLYIKAIIIGDGTTPGATQKLFNSFVDNSSYQAAVGGALVLSVVIFGAAFTMGLMQASFGQVMVRLIKMGIIFSLISAGGWEFFNSTVVNFFTNGTDDLVKGVIAIGTGVPAPEGATPFYQMDKLANFMIQPDTIIAIMGAITTGGPFGLMMSGLMVVASMGFVLLMVKALRYYAVAFVARSLLLGLAPIFFIFLLFERTKNLFTSWLNALITLALQPVLLFTFLGFFLVLIQTASVDMFGAELCWDQFAMVQGTANKTAFWTFVDPQTGQVNRSPQDWKGPVQCQLEGRTDCPEFPMHIVDVLSFLILVYLAGRFADSIERIANELSNAFITLDTGGRLDQFFKQQSSGGGGLFSFNRPAARPGPTGTR